MARKTRTNLIKKLLCHIGLHKTTYILIEKELCDITIIQVMGVCSRCDNLLSANIYLDIPPTLEHIKENASIR